LDPILGHRGHLRGGDHLRVHADLNRLEDVPAGQIDRRSLLERERDLRLIRRDQGVHHPLHVPAGEVVDLEIVDREIQTSLPPGNQRIHDGRRIHLSETHAEQGEERDSHTRRERPDPEAYWDEPEEDDEEDEGDEDQRQHQAETQGGLVHVLAFLVGSQESGVTV
jgi:hypothetical protein